MQSFSAKGLAHEIFPCIVCSLKTSSVDELHNHQRYCHTTEELSLSVICLVHYMCLKNEVSGLDVASKYPLLLQSHAANYHFYQLQNQRNTNSNDDWAVHNPPLDNSETSNKTKQLIQKNIMAKVREQGDEAPHYSLISAGYLRESKELLVNAKMMSADFSTTFMSSWELELGRVPEISNETFLKSVNGICKDLEIIEKPTMERRRGFLKSANQTNRATKKNGKKISRSQKSFVLSLRQTSTKGLQRSQTPAKSLVVHQSEENVIKKHQETTPINYSFTNNHDAGIPVLEEELRDLNYQQELEEMPVLEPHLRIIELPQSSDIQIKTKDDKESQRMMCWLTKCKE